MKINFCILLCMACSVPAWAEEITDHTRHLSVINSDSRQLVSYPPDVRAHALATMREHLEALAEIMNAFAHAKYTEAAALADTRLGMDSSGAAACQMNGMKMDMKTIPMPGSAHLDQQMSLFMPEKMRELGQNLHRAANEFAINAREADKDSKYATAAAISLARITQQCVACHRSYRMK